MVWLTAWFPIQIWNQAISLHAISTISKTFDFFFESRSILTARVHFLTRDAIFNNVMQIVYLGATLFYHPTITNDDALITFTNRQCLLRQLASMDKIRKFKVSIGIWISSTGSHFIPCLKIASQGTSVRWHKLKYIFLALTNFTDKTFLFPPGETIPTTPLSWLVICELDEKRKRVSSSS